VNLLELTAPFRKAIAAAVATAAVVALAKIVDVPSDLGPVLETVVGSLLTAAVVYVTRNRPPAP
jgi:hypothetical protein